MTVDRRFDDFLSDLRTEIVRCADAEGAAQRTTGRETVPTRDTRAGARRLARPARRRVLAWAAVLVVGVVALGAGFLATRPETGLTPTPAANQLIGTPGAVAPAYVQSPSPAVSATSSATDGQTGATAGYGLSAIAVGGPADVWAVGATIAPGSGLSRSFVLHWNGTAWRETPAPDLGNLTAVTAARDGEAWALSESGSMVHWNGTLWEAVQDGALQGAVLHGLTALASNDVWAVGARDGTPLALHWDGASWQATQLPAASDGGALEAVSGSSSDDVWTVGTAADGVTGVALRWNGSSWSVAPGTLARAASSQSGTTVAGGGGLSTAAALAPDNVWVGGGMLLHHWDGASWTDVRAPFDVAGTTIAAAGNGIWICGRDGLARWDGQAWRDASDAGPQLQAGSTASVRSVTTAQDGVVWAAGIVSGSAGGNLPLIIRRDGETWRVLVDSVQTP